MRSRQGGRRPLITAFAGTNRPALANAPCRNPYGRVGLDQSDPRRRRAEHRRGDLNVCGGGPSRIPPCRPRSRRPVVAECGPGLGDMLGGWARSRESNWPCRCRSASPLPGRRPRFAAPAHGRLGRLHWPSVSSVERDVVRMVVKRHRASPGRTMFAATQLVTDSMSRASASSCIADSTAKAGWVIPYPRSAPLGTVLV